MQWIYSHGGVFPVRRGARDEEAFVTAEAILARGGAITMYCEGGRSRTGSLAEQAKRGIGRLALETGAPVVPIAIHGSSRIRNWKRLRLPEVTVQYGRAAALGARRRTPRASSSRRSPKRCSPRSSGCTPAWRSTGAGALLRRVREQRRAAKASGSSRTVGQVRARALRVGRRVVSSEPPRTGECMNSRSTSVR